MVFPAPLGPKRPKVSPRSILKLTSGFLCTAASSLSDVSLLSQNVFNKMCSSVLPQVK